ncbi:MAG: hypothetical protein HXY40_09935 [Chloroflexi bacterium]|nr:hypothetical protein [Chloroflexota bacterium]
MITANAHHGNRHAVPSLFAASRFIVGVNTVSNLAKVFPSVQSAENSSPRLALWLLRLLLAALLIFASEVLLWTNILSRPPEEWLLRLIGYIALAALLLDLAERYRIREIYDVLPLTGIYGLCAGLLLHPQMALADFPRTLMTRVMGGHTLLAAEMFGLFLVLTGANNLRYRRLLLGFSLWLGFYWGIWMRWSPLLTDLSETPIDLLSSFLYAGVVLGAALILYIALLRRSAGLAPPQLRLSPAGLGITLILLLGLFIVRLWQNVLPLYVLPAFGILIVLCYAILWFRRPDRGRTLLDEHLPPRTPGWRWLVGASICFSGASIFSYNLPLVELFGFNQLSVMEWAFAAGGLLWLPAVAAVLSVRAIDRQGQRLD